MTSTRAQLLEQAKQEAATCETWADFGNFLYNPIDGLISMAFPVGPRRKRFMESPEYGEIQKLLEELQDRTGLIEGATPKRGPVVVCVPRSLRTSLAAEAEREGVSVDQLIVAKLSAPLSEAVSTRLAGLGA